MSEETARLLPGPPRLEVSSSFSLRRPASTTVKPACISASEAARPTPVPAPVTMAILFLFLSLASVIGFLPCYVFGVLWFRFFGLVRRPRDILMRGPQRRRPARTQVVEIGLACLDAVIEVGLAYVRTHHQHVDRKTDAEIGAHGRVHRDQAG